MNDASTSSLVGFLVLLILTSAFFSGTETGMMSLNRYRLKHLSKRSRVARRTHRLLDRPDRLITLILIGNNAVNILAAIIGGIIFTRLFGESAGIWATTLIMTLIMLIFAEVTPKTMAAVHPERIAFPASYALRPLMTLLIPVILLVNWITNAAVRAFGLDPTSRKEEHLSSDELKTVVDEAGNLIPDQHQGMLINVLDLENLTVNDIMVPRNEIVGLDLDAPIEELTETIIESDFTRLPVYQGDINNMHGILHLKRVNRILRSGVEQLTKEAIKRFATPPYFIPENTPLPLQLLHFQKSKRRVGYVVDEYGEIEGLATIDDILEEIVGNYTTNIGDDDHEITAVAGGYEIDGGASIREINRITGWQMPTDGPKTLSGLILEGLQDFPENPVCVVIDQYRIEVLELGDMIVSKSRVNQISRARTEEDELVD